MTIEELLVFGKSHCHSDHAKILLAELLNKNPLELLNFLEEQVDDEINFIYYFQLGVNALWSIFFFVFKWRLFSFLWILLLAVLVILMIIKFYNKNKTAGLIQIPYLLWVLFASYLNIGFYILNR